VGEAVEEVIMVIKVSMVVLRMCNILEVWMFVIPQVSSQRKNGKRFIMKEVQTTSRINEQKLMDMAEASLVMVDAKAKVTVDAVMEVHMVLPQ
jgi:hypothetical protein